MKKVNIDLIFDDRGNYIYYVDDKYLSPYMYYLYKVIKSSEEKTNTCNILSCDTQKYFNRINETKEELYKLFKKDMNATVGLFFYINDKLYIKNKKISEFADEIEFYDYEISFSEWFYNELILDETLNLCSKSDYKLFYRGKVVYDNRNNIFKIFTDPTLLVKPLFADEVLKKFNIDYSKAVYLFLFDEYYLLKNENVF